MCRHPDLTSLVLQQPDQQEVDGCGHCTDRNPDVPRNAEGQICRPSNHCPRHHHHDGKLHTMHFSRPLKMHMGNSRFVVDFLYISGSGPDIGAACADPCCVDMVGWLAAHIVGEGTHKPLWGWLLGQEQPFSQHNKQCGTPPEAAAAETARCDASSQESGCRYAEH